MEQNQISLFEADKPLSREKRELLTKTINAIKYFDTYTLDMRDIIEEEVDKEMQKDKLIRSMSEITSRAVPRIMKLIREKNKKEKEFIKPVIDIQYKKYRVMRGGY